jgi:hypothetical protein
MKVNVIINLMVLLLKIKYLSNFFALNCVKDPSEKLRI